MDREYKMIKEFHKKYGYPISEKPQGLSKERIFDRSRWMIEEILEFSMSENIVDQIDAIIDLIYFAKGALVEIGIDPTEVFNAVHKANMSKLIAKNSKSKGIKPKDFVDPKIFIREHIDYLIYEEK